MTLEKGMSISSTEIQGIGRTFGVAQRRCGHWMAQLLFGDLPAAQQGRKLRRVVLPALQPLLVRQLVPKRPSSCCCIIAIRNLTISENCCNLCVLLYESKHEPVAASEAAPGPLSPCQILGRTATPFRMLMRLLNNNDCFAAFRSRKTSIGCQRQAGILRRCQNPLEVAPSLPSTNKAGRFGAMGQLQR